MKRHRSVITVISFNGINNMFMTHSGSHTFLRATKDLMEMKIIGENYEIYCTFLTFVFY